MIDLHWSPIDVMLLMLALMFGASALAGGAALGAAWLLRGVEDRTAAADPLSSFQASCADKEVATFAVDGSTISDQSTTHEESVASVDIPTDIPAVLRRKYGVASRRGAYDQERSWREQHTRWDLLMLPAPEQKKKRKPRKRKSATDNAKAASSQPASKFDAMA